MGNIHLLIGDELLLKDLRINEILNTTEDYEYETFYMDSYKTENYNAMVNKINMFLGTYDFFSSSKVLKLVLSKPTQFNTIISKIDSFDDNNKLIIDLRCPEYLVKNTKFEYCGEQLKAEKFFKFKDYEKDKVGNYIKKCFKDNCINFKSDYDLDLANKVDADVVLATDPDADRLGIFAKDTKTGEYKEYTGNMSALLIAEYRISQMKEKAILPEDGMFITTVVSSELAKAIAKYYNLECIEVLTGFKNIGAVMKKAEENKDKTYVFGFEESYGCLIGDYARDKDGIAAVMALCEAACYYKSKNKT